MIRSISLCKYVVKGSIEICFIFFEEYCIFYAFLKFIRIFGNIKENENQKPGRTVLSHTVAHGPGTVGPAHEPFWPAGSLGWRGTTRLHSHHAQRAWGGALTGGLPVTGRGQVLAREHHGVSGVASGKVGQHGSHRRGGLTT
jgi:hypothetical protein